LINPQANNFKILIITSIMNYSYKANNKYFIKFFIFSHLLIFISCNPEIIVESTDSNITIKRKNFNYEITNKFLTFESSSDNTNLGKEYEINLDFKDSINLDLLKLFIVKSSSNDTVFKSKGETKINPIIDEFGNYDLIIIPETSININQREIIYRDTVTIRNYISLHYIEKWENLITSDQSHFMKSNGSLIFLDVPSQNTSVDLLKTLNNFNSCNELLLSLKYVIDQKNRASGQNLLSRPYFVLSRSNNNIININNGVDGKEEEKQVLISNIPNEFNLRFQKNLTFKYTDWRVVSAAPNTLINNDTIYSIAYDTLKYIGYPTFSRNIDSLGSVTQTNSVSSSTQIINVNNSIENLSFFIQQEFENTTYTYGQTNSILDIDGEPFTLNNGSGDYILEFDFSGSYSPKVDFVFGNGIENNKSQFKFVITELKIYCL